MSCLTQLVRWWRTRRRSFRFGTLLTLCMLGAWALSDPVVSQHCCYELGNCHSECVNCEQGTFCDRLCFIPYVTALGPHTCDEACSHPDAAIVYSTYESLIAANLDAWMLANLPARSPRSRPTGDFQPTALPQLTTAQCLSGENDEPDEAFDYTTLEELSNTDLIDTLLAEGSQPFVWHTRSGIYVPETERSPGFDHLGCTLFPPVPPVQEPAR